MAANGEQINDLGERNIPFRTKRRDAKVHDIQKCECWETSHFQCRKLSQAETLLCWMKTIHTFENIRDGTVIELDVNSGVYTMDMWICLDETGPVFSWQGQ